MSSVNCWTLPSSSSALSPGSFCRASVWGSGCLGEFGGSEVGDQPAAAVLVGPGVGAVAVALISPAAVGFQQVVATAQRCQIVGVGLSGWPGVVVGDDVVEVA